MNILYFYYNNNINKNNHGKIDTNIYNIEWQNIIDLLLKTDYHERPEIDEVIKSIKKIKESNLIKSSNHNDLDNISLNMLQRNDETNINNYNIIFIGGAGIGAKTSLIERLINNKFIEQPEITVGVNDTSKKVQLKNGKIIDLRFYDTSGWEKTIGFLPQYIRDSNCVILGFDSENTFSRIKDFWYQNIKGYLSGQLIYLIRNKIDLVQVRESEGKESRKFAEENNFRYFEMSCKTGEGVQEFYDDLITQITKIYI